MSERAALPGERQQRGGTLDIAAGCQMEGWSDSAVLRLSFTFSSSVSSCHHPPTATPPPSAARARGAAHIALSSLLSQRYYSVDSTQLQLICRIANSNETSIRDARGRPASMKQRSGAKSL